MMTKVKKGKMKQVASKATVQKRNRLNCFIREIEREELLDDDTLKMILAFHPIY